MRFLYHRSRSFTSPALRTRRRVACWVFSAALLLTGMNVFGQITLGEKEVVDYSRPKQYEIGGITVTGVQYLDKNVLVMLTGLNVGEKVDIPGEEISNAIKKLWDQGLFEDISVNITDIQGNLVFLELYLKERPRLSRFSIKGVSKTEADNIREKISISRGDVVTESLLMNIRHKIKAQFKNKGFLDATVDIDEERDTSRANTVSLDIRIDKNKRVKIAKILPEGNYYFSNQKIKNSLKETKEKGIFTPLNVISFS